MQPLCVLDFYVDGKVQRGGWGKILFDAMLEFEKQIPSKLAYDRPSAKLIGFMAKHFGLKSFVPQNNNYVVFDEYFKQSVAA
jgi:alpha-tubulin N-acetyltransferase 1